MLRLRTQSFRRYRIDGKLPSPFDPAFEERLTARRFQPLTEHEDRTYGWTSAENLLMTEFDVGTLVHGEHAAFALRIDQRRVSARLLRAHIDLELRGRQKAAEDAGHAFRVGREERRELREGLQRELMEKTNPSVESHVVLLHTKRKVLLVQSLSRRVNELVQLLFHDTFEVGLTALTPWNRAQEILAGSEALESLHDLRRTDFVPRGMRSSDHVPDRSDAVTDAAVTEVPAGDRMGADIAAPGSSSDTGTPSQEMGARS